MMSLSSEVTNWKPVLLNPLYTMSAINPGHIFNVPDPKGKELVELETTAGVAQAEASTGKEARQVEKSTEKARDVAHDAAEVAKSKGPTLTGTPPSAVDQFQAQAKEKTNAAVEEGQRDVEAAKASGANYVEQAKEMAASAVNAAQSYLPESASGIADTVKEYITSSTDKDT